MPRVIGKAGFPGGARIPLIMPPATCPSPAGARRRARAPATDRPEAHFPHPGRGGRQTSEGGGWGRAPGTPVAQLGRRPRLQLPGLGGDVALMQRKRPRRSPRALPAPGSCRAIGDPRKREVTKEEGSRRPLATPGPNAPGSEQSQTRVAPRKPRAGGGRDHAG